MSDDRMHRYTHTHITYGNQKVDGLVGKVEDLEISFVTYQ